MPMKTVRLTDIAREVGVSSATVSRVLTDGPHNRVSAQTRRKILNTAKRLGYEPNLAARTLVTGQAPLIGVVMPYLAAEQFPAIIAGVEARASAGGYQTLVVSGRGTGQVKAIEALMSHHVSGAIVCPLDKDEDEELREAADRLPPIVLVERPIPHPSAPTVSADNRHGGWQCGQWLAAQRCDRVLFVHLKQGQFPSVWTQRLTGLKEGLATAETEIRELFINEVAEEVLRQVLTWLGGAERPGFFLSTLLFLPALQRRAEAVGWNLPAHTHLCGFDRAHFTLDDLNVVAAVTRLEHPPYYVVYSGQAIGREAAELIIQRLGHGGWPRQTVTVPVTPGSNHNTCREKSKWARQ